MSGVDLFLGAFLLASLLLAALLVTLLVALLVALLLAAFYLVLLATFFLHGSLGGNRDGENGCQSQKHHFFHNGTVFKRFMFYVLSAAKI